MTLDRTHEEGLLDLANDELAAVRARSARVEREAAEARATLDDADPSDSVRFIAATANLKDKLAAAEYQTGCIQRAMQAVEAAERVMHDSFRTDAGRALLAERFKRERAEAKR